MSYRVFLIIAICLSAFTLCTAQGGSAEYRSPGGDEDRRPSRRSLLLRESQTRMRIERDKKEYDEMIERGDEVLRRSMQLERAVEQNGGVTDRDRPQISAIEKLAKQIRNQLGGDDDDDNSGPMSAAVSVKALKEATIQLQDELKKTSRFTISAAAIQSSNEVLRIARYLRSSTN